MAGAIKCDRCGKFVLEKDATSIGLRLQQTTIRFMSHHEAIAVPCEIVDVCPECNEYVESMFEIHPRKPTKKYMGRTCSEDSEIGGK